MGDIVRFGARPFNRKEAIESIRLLNPFLPNLLHDLDAKLREALIERTIQRSRQEPGWAERQRRLFENVAPTAEQ